MKTYVYLKIQLHITFGINVHKLKEIQRYLKKFINLLLKVVHRTNQLYTVLNDASYFACLS